MERTAARLAAAAAAILLLGASPAAAAPPEGRADAGAARLLAQEAKRGLADGSLGAILRGSGISEPVPGGAVPGDLPGAVAALSSAIARAGALVNAHVPTDADPEALRMAGMRAGMRGRAAQDPLSPAAHEAIERAGSIVAAAIDASLPALRRASSDGSGERVAGCDVVDQAPALCVAGTGDNVVTTDYALVVDLGGADLHAHSAGGADPLHNSLPVSVTIDLDGDDVYDAPIPTASGSWTAQGGGYLAGVGILVDAAGDDTYRIATEGPYALSMGQGKGEHGVGLLADLAGDDRYELLTSGDGWVMSVGQGDGANGVGILADRDGADRYTIRATATGFYETPVGLILSPSAMAFGQGVGRNGYLVVETPNPVHVDALFAGRGYGLFADGGGDDHLTIDARSPDPQQDEMFGPMLSGLPMALAVGMGYGEQMGSGLAILGTGATEASMTSVARAPRSRADSYGMGIGISLGLGAMDDAGGDDERWLRADVAVDRKASAAAGCDACPAPVATARTQHATVEGMGAGLEFGAGSLHDAVGADRNLVAAVNVAKATVHDEREAGDAGRATAITGPASATVHGVGISNGAGELLDQDGDDSYEVFTNSDAHASATAAEGTPSPEAAATSGPSAVLAQAAARTFGTGLLGDLDGADDYLTSALSVARAEPAGEEQQGAVSAGVLASVDEGSLATFTDRDDERPDRFTAAPATPACTGTRGQDAWLDCGGAGAGFMG